MTDSLSSFYVNDTAAGSLPGERESPWNAKERYRNASRLRGAKTSYKVRVPACDDITFKNAHIVAPRSFANFEHSLTALLGVKNSERLFDGKLSKYLSRAIKMPHLYVDPLKERDRQYKFTNQKLVTQECQQNCRLSTAKRSTTRQLLNHRNLLVELQTDTEPVVDKANSDIEEIDKSLRQDGALKCIVKRYAPTPEEQSFIATIKPRLITVIAAGIKHPRKTIRVFLSKTSVRSFNQVFRGISYTLSPENPLVQIFSTARNHITSLDDFFSDESIFIGFTENQNIRDEDFIILPQEEKKVTAYRQKNFTRNRAITPYGTLETKLSSPP